MMFKYLLIDLDDTILDFHKAEGIALRKTLRAYGVEPTDENCARYSEINKMFWERLERKELTRPQVMSGRFEMLFGELGVPVDPVACSETYMDNLSIGHYFLPGAVEALEVLHKKYTLYMASNGNAKVQDGRLKSANINHYFADIFVSQNMGADKPSKVYFDRCFARIPNFDPAKAMIIGDSLTSDILGGKNAGIATCWVNPNHKPAREDIRPDYEIESLSQLPKLLESIEKAP